MSAFDALLTMYLGGMLFPFCHLTLTSLLRIRRGFEDEHIKHEAWMEGFDAASDLHEKTARIKRRERLFGR